MCYIITMTKQQRNNIDLINVCHAIGNPAIMRGVAIHMREIGLIDHADHLDRIANAADKAMTNYAEKLVANSIG